MTIVRLAHVGPPTALETGLRYYESRTESVHILASYYYLREWMRNRPAYHFDTWVLDSGAFSAANSGAVIDLQQYIDTCLRLQDEDSKLVEVFALDVIGDPEASLRNAEEMGRQGCNAIPCFHEGEPWDFLEDMASKYPKIAVGGMVGAKRSDLMRFLTNVFARVWPKPIHGFGLMDQLLVTKFPFHSIDASSWEMGPTCFGNWRTFGQLPVRSGPGMNLKAEVDWYLALQRRLRFVHRHSLAALGGEFSV